MLYGLKATVAYVLGIDLAGRNFAVYPDDTFIVSYPRSGNTWTRFLLANLVFPDRNVDFTNIEKLIPDTTSQSNQTLKRAPRPRIIKTHEYFDHRYPKTIYIVRDPRDVALSYYEFSRKYMHIDDSVGLEAFVDDFVSGRLISSGWGTWGENVASWVYARGHSPTFLLLRYEEMRRNAMAELARVAKFMGIEPEPARLQKAIDLSSADRMRKLEKLQDDEWLKTLGYVVRRAQMKKKRKDIPFVGGAKAGGWRDTMPESCIHQIESVWGELMTKTGYELVTVSELQSAVQI
jgi:Sulfotransferase domain